MPKLSLYKPERGLDYFYHDRIIREMFVVGGTDTNIFMYKGPRSRPNSKDPSKPVNFDPTTEITIQDMLLLENRDRKYEKDAHTMRCIYNVQDLDFNLSQFGFFLQTDTVYITFHLNEMIERLGRKLMSGDVLELPHLVDHFPLDPNDEIPIALRKFYVVNDGQRAAEGFAHTWWPHLWRVKCTPIIDSPEYRDILGDGSETNDLKNWLSDYNKLIEINDVVVDQANKDVPQSGFETTHLFILPVELDPTTGDYMVKLTAQGALGTPTADIKTFAVDYLLGDGLPPNGHPVTFGSIFPSGVSDGEYHLRSDLFPNRLFRFNGASWIKIEDDIRTDLIGLTSANSLRAGFVNNLTTTTLPDGTTTPERVNIQDALAPQADNVVIPTPGESLGNPFSSEFTGDFD